MQDYPEAAEKWASYARSEAVHADTTSATLRRWALHGTR